MVKQKIQDNLSVLERDCAELLSETEGMIQSNKKNKARMQKVRSCLVTEHVFFVLGVVFLCLYGCAIDFTLAISSS